VRALRQTGFHRKGFFRGENLPAKGEFSTGWIQQESTFWRRSLWERSGAQVGAESKLAGDFELWARFYQHANLYAVETPLGGFRFHGDQKTGAGHETYLAEALAALKKHGGRRHTPIERLVRKIALAAPRDLRMPLARFGFLQPTKICRHNRHSGDWQVITNYE
jgi:hypothetical protein